MAVDGLGVVLVHGFRSGPETWQHVRDRIGEDDELKFVTTLPFSYATGLTRYHPLRTWTSISAAADSLREFLRTEAGGFPRVVLVSHSMGGLIVQRHLARMLSDGNGRELARIGRVVMLACPNDGSQLFLSLRQGIFGRRHPQESELRPLNEQVTETRRRVLHDVVHAARVTDRTCPIPFSVYAGDSDGVVPMASAQSVFRDTAALPGDHFGILRAVGAEHRTFTTLRRLLRETAAAPDPPGTAETSEVCGGLPAGAVGSRPAPGAPQPPVTVGNAISGGRQHAPVIQGHTVNVTFRSEPSTGTSGADGRDAGHRPPAGPAASSPVQGAAGLPVRSATFTGREDDVRALLDDLAPRTRTDAGATGTPRVPVLVQAVAGMGGVGKTELALQTAERALARPGWFPGGVLFADLNGYDPTPERRTSAEAVLDTFLRALGTPPEEIPADAPARSALLRTVLADRAAHGRRTLLVIDNAGSEEQVRPLLPGDDATAVLVTSRHSLDIGARLHTLDTLDAHASVDLIRQELHRARTGDTRVDDDPDAAARIADLCGHLPLALHVIAALLADTPQRPLASMADALADGHTRLQLLTRADRAVQAAFDLSYANLTPDQARLFRLLPLNPGPDLSTETAAHLLDADQATVEVLLTDLARAHLVEPGVWPRWRMHDLLRLHADHHGRTQADEDHRDTAHTRLLDHYLATAEAADTHLSRLPQTPRSPAFTDRRRALEWLDAEHANLTAAATTAPHNHPAHTDMTFALYQYFDLRRRFDDIITLANQTRTAHRETGDRHREGMAWGNLGLALREVRRFDEAIDAHQQDLDICRETGDRHGEGRAWNNLGLALRKVGRFDEAITAHQQDLDICRETGDRHGEGTAWNNLGLALREVGRFDDAITACTHARDIFRETGDRHGEGSAWNNLGLALRKVGRFDDAITAHTHARDMHRETGDRHGEGSAWNNLGNALQEVGRFDDAITAHTHARDMHRETGDRHGEGRAWNNLGNALQEVRRFDDAITAHQQDLDICRETGDRHGEGRAWNNLGLALRKVGRFDEAITAHQQDLDICRETGDRHGEGSAWGNLGLALQEVGRFDDAITAHTRARDICRETGDQHSEGIARANLEEVRGRATGG
ncbi:alpha/beta hydrolase [Streptantibioticus silvisoli]|uniref:Alpha/beta fold hydrolase n=1 Tax=Streptantibioticus silvisoli TaxID=2705255 RepID=A0ABT6VXQ6_9ACTN|nr:alpha/beta fold hydrolase [Streptantibioticus silvisoli]MDI5963266.1 alpha/beta fold hydrolase [Streptantibioticus silvisoli]